MTTGESARATRDSALRVVGLTKRWGDLLAVDRLELEVRRGEILGFLGPNGAGKTTTLRMMCGLLRPDAGTIEIGGRRVVAGETRGLREIGVAPQNLVIWETLTCLEQLELAARLYGRTRSVARARAEHLLAVLGLTDKADRLAKTLSGGMQRRLNIALGLAHEPEILFLDEPQAGLDPQSRLLVRDYLQSLRGKMTVIVTTHDMEEAEKLADRVCIVDHGKLLVLDTVEGLKRRLGGGNLTELVLDAVPRAELLEALEPMLPAGTLSVQGSKLAVAMKASANQLALLLQEISRQGQEVLSVRTRDSTLEDVFIGMTGRSLRE